MYNSPPDSSNSRDYYASTNQFSHPSYYRPFYDGSAQPAFNPPPGYLRPPEVHHNSSYFPVPHGYPERFRNPGGHPDDFYSRARLPPPPPSGSSQIVDMSRKRPAPSNPSRAGPPRKANVLYCELCKVSCVGPKALADHQRGQRHQKRLAKKDTPTPTPSTPASSNKPAEPDPQSSSHSFRCELCEITTTGPDSYTAHLAGKAHQRALKLHRDMGKPIPALLEVASSTPVGKSNQVTKLEPQSTSATNTVDHSAPEGAIGAEYVEIIDTPGKKAIYYRCKLCDCQFTNREGRDLHLLGRRHKWQYKMKVDPSFIVDATARGGRLTNIPPMPNPNRLPWATFLSPANRSRSALNWREPNVGLASRYLTVKHSQIVPTDLEARAIKTVVSICEHALKEISNGLLAGLYDKEKQDIVPSPDQTSDEHRMLRGVVRVGSLGKSLLLRGDHEARLVLVCAEWPTVELLGFLKTELESQLIIMDPGFTYEVLSNSSSGTLTVVATKLNESEPWPSITVYIQVTSPVLLNQSKASSNNTEVSGAVAADGPSQSNTNHAVPLRTVPEQPLVKKGTPDRGRHLFAHGLERIAETHCLDALDAIDQAKWFQAALSKLPLGVVSRLLVDFMRSNVIWLELDEFAVLALLDRLLTFDMQALCRPVRPFSGAPPGPMIFPFSTPSPSPPAPQLPLIPPLMLFRRFFEAIASGLLLQLNSPDIAEKSKFFAFGLLSEASLDVRLAVTQSAQVVLRQIAFNQLDKLLHLETTEMGASVEGTDEYPVADIPSGVSQDVDRAKTDTGNESHGSNVSVKQDGSSSVNGSSAPV